MSNIFNTKLLNAKRELYCLLLQKEAKDYTDSDIDIMYSLSKDKDIQEILQKNVGEKK